MMTQIASYLLRFHRNMKTDSWYHTRLGQDKACICYILHYQEIEVYILIL